MELTPVDVMHLEFKRALRGYDRAQVDQFVQSVTETLEASLKERCELQKRIDVLDEELKRLRAIEATMTEAITLAQKSAEELKTNAHRQADMILREAEQERVRMRVEAQKDAEKLRTDVSLLESTRNRFQAELKALLTGYMEWLDRQTGDECQSSDAEVA